MSSTCGVGIGGQKGGVVGGYLEKLGLSGRDVLAEALIEPCLHSRHLVPKGGKVNRAQSALCSFEAANAPLYRAAPLLLNALEGDVVDHGGVP